MSDLDELKALAEAATPGPWQNEADQYGRPKIKDSNGWTLADLCTLAPNGPRFKAPHDAALIVAAVNALPDLISRLEKAEGALRYYADPENWEYKNVGETVYIEMCPIQSDKGETASRALGGDNHE